MRLKVLKAAAMQTAAMVLRERAPVTKADGRTLLIGGDTCPSGLYEGPFGRGDVNALVGDLGREFADAHLAVLNLECPLTHRGMPIKKQGPHLRARPECVTGFKALGITAVSLANNHIRDFGPEGTVETTKVLDESGIRWFGLGTEAGRMTVVTLNSLRVGLLGMAESEFSVVNGDPWSANSIDIVDYVRQVSKVRPHLDALVVLVHAGNELCPYPSPWLQKLCRFLIEYGATAVICQHSHVAGTYEVYDGGVIVYGQGNFLFGPASASHGREGFLVKLILEGKAAPPRFDIIPYLSTGHGLRRMTAAEEQEFRRAIQQRNEALSSPEILRERWREFALSRSDMYVSGLVGEGRIARALRSRLGLNRLRNRLYDARRALNYVRCESHREAVISVLEELDSQRP